MVFPAEPRNSRKSAPSQKGGFDDERRPPRLEELCTPERSRTDLFPEDSGDYGCPISTIPGVSERAPSSSSETAQAVQSDCNSSAALPDNLPTSTASRYGSRERSQVMIPSKSDFDSPNVFNYMESPSCNSETSSEISRWDPINSIEGARIGNKRIRSDPESSHSHWEIENTSKKVKPLPGDTSDFEKESSENSLSVEIPQWKEMDTEGWTRVSNANYEDLWSPFAAQRPTSRSPNLLSLLEDDETPSLQ